MHAKNSRIVNMSRFLPEPAPEPRNPRHMELTALAHAAGLAGVHTSQGKLWLQLPGRPYRAVEIASEADIARLAEAR